MRRPSLKIQHAAWLGVAAVLLVFQTDHPLDSDEGVVLAGAWNLLNGRAPYQDFFCVLPPGSFYLVALAWRVLGESYLVANGLACSSLLLAALGVDRLARLVTGSPWAPLAALLYVLPSGLWPLVNHGSFGITWVVWAAFFFARGLESRRRADFLLAGLLNGLSMLFLLQRGLAVLAAFAALLLLLACASGAGAGGAARHWSGSRRSFRRSCSCWPSPRASCSRASSSSRWRTTWR
jgi:hypothetical protein